MISEERKKKMDDMALGDAITKNLDVYTQIGILRKQVIAISIALKVPLVDEMTAFEAVVSTEKEKREAKKNIETKDSKKSKSKK